MADSNRFHRKLALVRDAFARSPVLPAETTDTFDHWARTHGLSLPSVSRAPRDVAASLAGAFLPADALPATVDGATHVHPFSGREAPLPEMPAGEHLHHTLATALDALVLPEDPSASVAFAAIWRNLPALLHAHSPDGSAPLWDRVPATPQLPDQTLLQHARIATAFADLRAEDDGLQTDTALVLFTLGPVQQFIQQARKTKDLYWGSYLLSRLCWTGIRAVIQTFGPDALIFPDLHGQPLVDRWMESELDLAVENSQVAHCDLPTLPNRFFAVIEAPTDAKVAETLRGVSDAVQTAWRERGEQLFADGRFGGITPPDAFARHMEQALSTYWSGIRLQRNTAPITPEGTLDRIGDHFPSSTLDEIRDRLSRAHETASGATRFGLLYDVLYTLTEKRLGAQKTVRNFDQIRGGVGERGRKCSLCGERNALFHRCRPSQVRHNEETVDMTGKADLVHLREGEGLCGVCFTKRFIDHTDGTERGRRFDATADVATAPMRTEDGSSVQMCETSMQDEVGAGRFDRQLLYRENLTPDYLGSYVFPEHENDRSFLQAKAESLRAIHDAKLSDAAKEAQSSYYAIIALDGDNMGKWLSGGAAPQLEDLYPDAIWQDLEANTQSAIRSLGRRPMTPAAHASMSRALATFALQQVRPIVDEHNGFLVYAGGDDVLAFVSVDAVLDVLIDLRAAFSGHRRPSDGAVDFTDTRSGFVATEDRVWTTLGPTATASAGVAIAHYKAPLGMVLDTAYTMEKTAKDAGRDRAAIAVLKRSGERNEAVLPFRTSDDPRGLLQVFRTLVRDLQRKDISPAFMRTLRQELYPLMNREEGTLEDFPIEDDFLHAELKRLILRTSNAGRAWAVETADRLLTAYNESGLSNDGSAPNLRNFLAALDISLFLRKETTAPYVSVD